jgi:demethylmenaquinone methyltransferase/2-methoxy-6-polyprenyl-1,4-benzoquinol methylase
MVSPPEAIGTSGNIGRETVAGETVAGETVARPPRTTGRPRSSAGTPGRPGSGGPLPTGAAKVKAVRHMFDSIADRYEMVNRVMALGLDRNWRRRCVESLELPIGATVLDVACGTGDLCRQLSQQGLRPVGVDLSSGMLAHARTQAPLVLADALSAPFATASFAGAVSGFALRNVVDLGVLFAELARVTEPGGRISLLDLCEPENLVLRSGHRLWSNYAIPFIGSVLSDAQAYQYLPRSLAYLPPVGTVVEWLEKAGFGAVEHELLSGGICQLYMATRLHEAHMLQGAHVYPEAQVRPEAHT